MSRSALAMVMLGMGVFSLGAATSGAALADAAGAATCAGGLDANARMVFDATAPTVKPGVVVKDALKAVVRPMVMSGKLDRSAARVAAEAAGPCLTKLTQ